MTEWNPRYVAYAAAHGLTVPEMKARDRAAWPFMIWNGQRWREWERETGWRGVSKSMADHAAYDAWLAARYLPTPTLFDLLDVQRRAA